MLENNNFHENQLSETEKQAQTIKNSDYLYLEKLDFKPELRKSWLNFFVTRSRVVFLLILLLIMLGVFSFSKLPRESSPEVKIPIGVIITSYPGASPSDVEELVTKKIETKIAGLADIKKISSTSANSLSSITVEYDAKANLEDSFRKLRDKINDVKTDLPSEANEPIFKEISLNDTPIWSASLVGPYDGFTLREYGNKIKEELEKIPGVREVRISGGDEKEFEVAYDPNKLTYYKIAADQANQIIKSNNLAIPSGTFEGEKFSYPVRSDSRFFSAEELGNIPLFHSSEGAIVYLKDVAKVQERVIKKTVYSRFSINGQKPQTNVSIEIIKKTGGSIIEAVNTAEQKIKIMLAAISPDLHYDVNLNMAELIDKDFKQLNHDLLLTFILVFIILFVIIGFKEALVAGLAIPLVFSAAFGVMLQAGISLNFLSIFSLILSLGLLVDDAIVVVSATKQYLKTGKFTPEEAVLLVLNDFKMVLTTTTLTTVWAFLPLLFSTGIMGEYIKSIPVTVSVTLLASLVIAIIINHPLAATLERIRLNRKLFFVSLGALLILALLLFKVSFIVGLISTIIILAIIFVSFRWYRKTGKPLMLKNEFLVLSEKKDDDLIKKKLKEQGNEHDQNFINRLIHGLVNFNLILPVYEKYLRRFVTTRKNRLKVLGFTSLLFIFAILLPITGIVQSEFFPVSDQESVFIDIEAPIGLNLEETDKYVIQVEEKLLPYKEIANFATLVGVPSQFSSSNNGSHLASITIRLKDKKERKLKSYQLEEKIRQDLKTILGVNIKVSTESGGPPAGSAFEARISGDDLQILDRIAKELKAKLETIPGVTDPSTSLKESPAEYTFSLDYNRLELYNLNAAYVGSTLRMAITGTETTNVIKDGDEIKVVARFAEDKLPNLEAIQNLQIINLKGQPVFIKDVAKIELKPSVDAITRLNQKRTVLLSANVLSSANPQLVLKDFQERIKEYSLPEGYEISYGGQNEQNAESVTSIIYAMGVAFLLIISTLIVQFNSVRKSLIVLMTIPLALIGVFVGLAVIRIHLSFPGLIGVLALFGIVVKNAIILVDKINLNLKSGIPHQEAIIDAGKSRLEAIFITSVCTIFGILPVTLSNEMWRALGSVVICGLLFSSFLTLFIIPTLFATFIKPEDDFPKQQQ